MANSISEETVKIEIDETFIEVLCDVVQNNWPDGIVVKPLEIQGISVFNFKREYVNDVASKCHEHIVNEQAEKRDSKLEYYDEGDR